MTFTHKSLTLISLISMIAIGFNPVNAIFGLPDNVEFVTHMYNDTNCSNTSSFMNILCKCFV